jgi:glycine/D-amino acid oxidase-like deaminating enzyme
LKHDFKAKRLPRQPGPAAWNAILPPQGPAKTLAGPATADIAIIGAGFAGLSAARRLLQLDPSLKIALLEAGRVAEGPAGRNSGFMIDLPHDLSSDDYAGKDAGSDSLQTALNRLAIRFGAEAAEEYGMPAEYFDPCGKTNAAATESGDHHNREYAKHLADLGEEHSLLDAKQMREKTGTDYYLSGLYTPGTVMLQPAGYIRGLAGGLENALSLYENSPVTRIISERGNWRLETPNGSISTPKVILANNGHAESFGFFPHRLMHVFTYASMTKALSAEQVKTLGGQPNWGVTPADPMGSTVRRISGATGDRIIVRFRFTYDPSMEVSDRRIAAIGHLHDAKFAERFPMLKGAEMEYRWAGLLCLTWNGVPAFGEIEDGIYSACCQNGLGTAKGTLSGIAAAELALGHDTEAVRGLAGQDAPRRLPPQPFAYIGANAVLRWKEWRAGRE